MTDASGNSNTGTLGTGVTRTASGKFGGALSFNHGYVTIPDAASLDLTAGLTLEAWVYPTVAPSSWATVVLKEQPGDYVYTLYNSGPSNPSGEINVGTATSGERIAMGPSPVPLNTWTHLTSTYDGSAVRLYVNGALVGIKAATGPVTASAGVLRIGGNAVWGEFFTGRIDEVRVYNRALSIGEIQADMGKPVSGPTPVDVTAPTVSISSPTSVATYATTATQVALGGTAGDNIGVTQVSWANDRGGAGTATGTTSWTASPIPLQLGTNNITVTARDAANNVATRTLVITASAPVATAATALAITTQPSAAASSGSPFGQQPVLQLRDASNAAVAQSGVVVTAAIASGSGSLIGSTTATTNASGVATFSGIGISGSGSYTLRFAATGLTAATSSAISVTTTTTTTTTSATDEPVFNAATGTIIMQDNMDSYTSATAMGVGPYGSGPRIAPSPSPVLVSQPVNESITYLIPGRGGSGKALRMAYSGLSQDSREWEAFNVPIPPDTATHFFQYWARVMISGPLTNTLNVKWFEAWHRYTDRIQWNTHWADPAHPNHQCNTCWQIYDQSRESIGQGDQPVGPFFEGIADGQWHRFTYSYKPHTTAAARDGFARMWVDGVKIIDVSAATINVTPPGGDKVWCSASDVDALAVNEGIRVLVWGSTQTTDTPPWTYDVDDFTWWIKK